MYVGVDVHKRVCRAAMVNDDGEVVDEFSFRNSPPGIEELVTRIEAFGERVLVAVESTANLWIRVYDSLEEKGIGVVLSNPYKTRLIAEARIKTDKVDARILAQLLRADMLPLCYVPSREQRDRRQFIRHRVTLVRMRTEVKNRIHALLDRHGLRCPYKTLFSKRGVDWLKGLELGFTDDAVLSSDLALLEVLDGQIAFMEARIAVVAVRDDRVRLLMTMPGLGYFSASLLVHEICDINRFSSDKKLVSWAGWGWLPASISPAIRPSVEGSPGRGTGWSGGCWWRRPGTPADTTRGSTHSTSGTLGGRRGQKGVVAVAHEMLRIAYFMLKRGEAYRGERRDLSERKLKRLERVASSGLRA